MSIRLKPTLLLAGFLVLSVLMVLPSLAYADSGGWVKYSGNPVFGPSGVLGPTPGSWDGAFTTTPRVLYEGRVFKMWYNGGDMSGFGGIGYAVSGDGFAWSKHAGPVLLPGPSGSWDSAGVSLGSVLWNGTLFLMYYRGSNPTTFDKGAIGMATSNDGSSWTKYSNNPILVTTQFGDDQGYVASPWVIKLEQSYDMWYVGKGSTTSTTSRILHATSMDGIQWVKWPGPVFSPSTDSNAWDSSAVFSPAVYFNGTTFGMWYSALGPSQTAPQIGVATSPDGATWTRSSYNPVLSSGAGNAWDSAGVEQPSVVVGPNNNYMLYYDGQGSSTSPRIGLAQAQQSVQIFPIPEFPYAGLLLGVMAFASIGVLSFRKK